MILALDISTSITGITVLDKNIIILNESVDTKNKKKFPHINDVALKIKEAIEDIKFPITEIYIEESLKSFRSGFSSAQTISQLSKINGIITYICEQHFKIRPEHVSAATARKVFDIKKTKDKTAKEMALEYLKENRKDFIVGITKTGKTSPETYDRADSLIIALASEKFKVEKD